MWLSSSDTIPKFSVVVPVGPGDKGWIELLTDLAEFPDSFEYIFTATEAISESEKSQLLRKLAGKSVRWNVSPPGRALQLNKGAELVQAPFVWFLHADSRLSSDCPERLLGATQESERTLHYFNLKFLADGPKLIWINSLGAWIRSHLFCLPFGDQGFALSKALFDELGGYSEDVLLGEDHHFVWKAKKAGVKVKCTGSTIYTSARKYKERGWLSVTLSHLYYTVKQASPFILGGR